MKPEFSDKASALSVTQRVDIFLGQLQFMEQQFNARRAEFNIFLPRLADYTHLMNLRTDVQKDEFMAALKPPSLKI